MEISRYCSELFEYNHFLGDKLNEWNSNMGSMLDEIAKAKQAVQFASTDVDVAAVPQANGEISSEDSVGK